MHESSLWRQHTYTHMPRSFTSLFSPQACILSIKSQGNLTAPWKSSNMGLTNWNHQECACYEKKTEICSLAVTNLCTNTSCTDDGEEGVSLWPHSHLDTWEQLREFFFILFCGADCVDKYLRKPERPIRTEKRKEQSDKMMLNLSVLDQLHVLSTLGK